MRTAERIFVETGIRKIWAEIV